MIRYPKFKPILAWCRRLMNSKYLIYRNSWVGESRKSFWLRRLNGEVNEIKKAKNFIECQKEICDTINVLAMMYENAEDFRYKKK